MRYFLNPNVGTFGLPVMNASMPTAPCAPVDIGFQSPITHPAVWCFRMAAIQMEMTLIEKINAYG
jgi:hypothetical protein